MNNKTVLTMIEQVIAVLVFSIAAAICLKVFAYSASLSNETESISNACVMIQNASELIKNTSGDINKITSITGWDAYDDTIIVADNKLLMTINFKDTSDHFLGNADIVLTENGRLIDHVEVYYQKTCLVLDDALNNSEATDEAE